MSILVKIGKLPGTLVDVALEDNATVADAMRAADIAQEAGWSLRVDGATGSPTQSLRQGSVILLAKEAKSA